ncbi:MAG: 30S ribosomal protein S11 [Candidatus Yanofskybacteria bacterium]|nr:30S ribosomal protein S11 [Candidatus Yanofskybacteria bacterium]
MGQKRVTTTVSGSPDENAGGSASAKKAFKKQVFKGAVNIFSSYNNTIVSVADPNGNVFSHSSAGMLGFKGTKKSTPYAATLVGKDAVEKAKKFGFQEAKVTVSGIGPGREAAIRGVASSGINIVSIVDVTPMAHNGVRPTKPRRV